MHPEGWPGIGRPIDLKGAHYAPLNLPLAKWTADACDWIHENVDSRAENHARRVFLLVVYHMEQDQTETGEPFASVSQNTLIEETGLARNTVRSALQFLTKEHYPLQVVYKPEKGKRGLATCYSFSPELPCSHDPVEAPTGSRSTGEVDPVEAPTGSRSLVSFATGSTTLATGSTNLVTGSRSMGEVDPSSSLNPLSKEEWPRATDGAAIGGESKPWDMTPPEEVPPGVLAIAEAEGLQAKREAYRQLLEEAERDRQREIVEYGRQRG